MLTNEKSVVMSEKKIDIKIFLLKFLAITAFIIGLVLLAIGNNHFFIINETVISLSVVSCTIIVALILLFIGVKNKFLKTYRAYDILNWTVINLFVVPFCLFSVAYTINGAFDPHDSETFEVKIIDAKKEYRYGNKVLREGSHYSATVKNWRSEPDYIELKIEKNEYKELLRVERGRYITIVTKPGLFGEEWIVSVGINPVGKIVKESDSKLEQNIGGLQSYDES